jgi:hypothetical protein
VDVMTEQIWTIVFKSYHNGPVDRPAEEQSRNFPNEKAFRAYIAALKEDRWQNFVRGILPGGQEVT